MSKFYNNIGFVISKETSPGVWVEKPVIKKYRGDVIRNYIRYDSQSKINSDINMNVNISIIADSYIRENLGRIRFVEFEGSFWNIESIEPQWPRLVLTIGGIYNGPKE